MSWFTTDVNQQRGTTFALTEPDLGVVRDLFDRLVVLDYGKKIADAPPDAIKADRLVIAANLGLAH